MLKPSSGEQGLPAILLVEDNDDDVFLMKRALRSSGVDAVLETVSDGRSAVEYLMRAAQTGAANAQLPNVVFLDLKLPYLSGFEVLTFIRSHPRLHHLPVVMLTSSSEDRDRRLAAQLAADGYLVKPPTREMLREAIERLQRNDRKTGGPDSVCTSN